MPHASREASFEGACLFRGCMVEPGRHTSQGESGLLVYPVFTQPRIPVLLAAATRVLQCAPPDPFQPAVPYRDRALEARAEQRSELSGE